MRDIRVNRRKLKQPLRAYCDCLQEQTIAYFLSSLSIKRLTKTNNVVESAHMGHKAKQLVWCLEHDFHTQKHPGHVRLNSFIVCSLYGIGMTTCVITGINIGIGTGKPKRDYCFFFRAQSLRSGKSRPKSQAKQADIAMVFLGINLQKPAFYSKYREDVGWGGTGRAMKLTRSLITGFRPVNSFREPGKNKIVGPGSLCGNHFVVVRTKCDVLSCTQLSKATSCAT